jgi:aminopeptidase-like protein
MFDGTSHPMAVIGSSPSFQGTIAKVELDKHVFSSRVRPDAFAFHCINNYRPWAREWGFCVPYNMYREWPNGDYEIDLKTEFRPGTMLVADAILPGQFDEEIVLNAHTCHPCQFEDGFSGVALILELFHWLASLPRRRYTYRAVLAPEHLGTIFYLDRLGRNREHIVGAFFVEMIGLKTPLAIQKSFHGDSIIDRLAIHSAKSVEPEARIGDFRTILGNDETVWEAPGYEIPCVSISRCSHSPSYYDEYHTSDDTLARSDLGKRAVAFDVLRRIVEVLETDAVMNRNFDGLIALSNPKYDLYVERPDPTVQKQLSDVQLRLGSLQDRVLRYFDGNRTLFELAEAVDLPFDTLVDYVKGFEHRGLVQLVDVSSLSHYQGHSTAKLRLAS